MFLICLRADYHHEILLFWPPAARQTVQNVASVLQAESYAPQLLLCWRMDAASLTPE